MAEKHAALAESQQKTDQRLRESFEKTGRRLRESREETDRQLRDTGQFLKEVGRQIGGLGEKFGSFTEGLALPSMTRILREDFGMQVIAPRVSARSNGHSLEVDVLAYSNTSDDVYVVEVKSHLREDSLEQMRRILRDSRSFFPVHCDKRIYGILAAVDAPEEIRDRVLPRRHLSRPRPRRALRCPGVRVVPVSRLLKLPGSAPPQAGFRGNLLKYISELRKNF